MAGSCAFACLERREVLFLLKAHDDARRRLDVPARSEGSAIPYKLRSGVVMGVGKQQFLEALLIDCVGD
jgi:hypothetical protein